MKPAKMRQFIRYHGFTKFILAAIDTGLYLINGFLKNGLYRWTKDNFGLKEALFWSRDIAFYLRYSKILGELKNTILNSDRKIRILEVGPGGEGISRFLRYSGDYKKCDIQLADPDANALRNIKLGNPVVASGYNLPFENSTFDAVISVDTLEHIPKDKRGRFLEELKRVSKVLVLLHFVMHDPDRQFLGKVADLRFQEWHLKHFKKEHSWTTEHLTIEPPTCDEINKALPGSIIAGTQNIESWFEYTTLSMKPIIGFAAGFLYILKWKHKDNSPPFHGCFVKWIQAAQPGGDKI
jgi:hypothetical protein